MLDSTKVEELHELLRTDPVYVRFRKKDGTDRCMLCTLDPALIPKGAIPYGNGHPRIKGSSIAVYDLEKNGWRSFSRDSVMDYTPLTLGPDGKLPQVQVLKAGGGTEKRETDEEVPAMSLFDMLKKVQPEIRIARF